MSSEYSNSSDRRSSRRGGRRSSRGRSYSPRSSRQESTPAKPQKKTLWQKIAGFFSSEEAPKTTPARLPESRRAPDANRNRNDNGNGPGRSARSERPERPARPERADRPGGFRKPEIIEVTSARVYVGNLSFDATESDLSELFNGVGTVDTVEIVSNKHTHKSKGFGFIQMQSLDEAKRAVVELHDKEYMGRKLVVSGAKALDEKRSERTRQSEPSGQ